MIYYFKIPFSLSLQHCYASCLFFDLFKAGTILFKNILHKKTCKEVERYVRQTPNLPSNPLRLFSSSCRERQIAHSLQAPCFGKSIPTRRKRKNPMNTELSQGSEFKMKESPGMTWKTITKMYRTLYWFFFCNK